MLGLIQGLTAGVAALAAFPVAPVERTELHLGAGGVGLALRYMNSYFPELQVKGKQGIKEFAIVAARPAGCEEIVHRGGLDVLIRLLPDPEFQPYAALALAHIAAGPIIHDVTGTVALAGAGAPIAPADLLPQFAPLLRDANPRFRQSAMLAIMLSPAGVEGLSLGLAELALGMAEPGWDIEIVAQHGIAPILALVQQLTGLLQHPQLGTHAAIPLACIASRPEYAPHVPVPLIDLVRLSLAFLSADLPFMSSPVAYYAAKTQRLRLFSIREAVARILADIGASQARHVPILPWPELLRVMTDAFLDPFLPNSFFKPSALGDLRRLRQSFGVNVQLMRAFYNLSESQAAAADVAPVDIDLARAIMELSSNEYACQPQALKMLTHFSRSRHVCLLLLNDDYFKISPIHFFRALSAAPGDDRAEIRVCATLILGNIQANTHGHENPQWISEGPSSTPTRRSTASVPHHHWPWFGCDPTLWPQEDAGDFFKMTRNRNPTGGVHTQSSSYQGPWASSSATASSTPTPTASQAAAFPG